MELSAMWHSKLASYADNGLVLGVTPVGFVDFVCRLGGDEQLGAMVCITAPFGSGY
jgi:hypothetical protein